MEKKPILWVLCNPHLKKLVMELKIGVILLLTGFINVFATPSYSQGARISLNVKDMSLEQVMDEIERQSEFYFVFNQKQIDVTREVSMHVDNSPIDDVLVNLFKGSVVHYLILDKTILLSTDSFGQKTESGKISLTAKQGVVTGKVIDKLTGEPLPGVNVVVKGTTTGVITDASGNYSINVSDNNAVLTFSFIGYATVEAPVAGKSVVEIALDSQTKDLEEVVVVGFGTQRKVNLTGSVAAVGNKDIEKLTVTQTSQLLTGLVSGVTVEQSSGQPGKDQVNITVHGQGTFSSAGTQPLVLVDGLASSLDNVNINDIASISVLKDAASAAIYGTRAANGVILVETKKGKEGEFKVSYQGSVGWQRPAQKVKIVDSWMYAEAYNEALINSGVSPQYGDDEIAKFISGEDQDNYPNKRHYHDLINSGSGFQTDHHLSFTGGTNRNSYMFSLGYLNQDAIIAKTNYDRYNLLINVDSKIKDNLKLSIKLSGQKGESNEPTAVDKNPKLGVEGLVDYSIKIPNTYAGKMSNGYYGNQTGFTIEGWMDSNSFISNDDLNAVANLGLDWDIFKNLKLTIKSGYEYGMDNYKLWRPVLVVDQYITASPADLTVKNTSNTLLTLQTYLNYDLQIKDHALHFLAGYSQESDKINWLQGFRDNFPSNTLFELNAGAASNQQSSGSASEWALLSYFGRINYSYKGRYLLEGNLRYDGSSRFPNSKRYGLFPSISVGWNVSHEDFFKVGWIDNLKIRGSYGELGNQNIGNYPYQQMLTLGLNAPFGVSEKLWSGAAATVVPNANITWEATRVADFGFDISVLKNKLTFSADYYDKLTTGILYNVTASAVLGLIPSVTNAGTVSNKGIDFSIQHQNSIGDFNYSVSANFSYVKNEVKKLANVTRDIAAGLFIGSSLDSYYGYVADGLFVDQSDINNSPSQPYTAHPGDIKFLDINGPDGVPDGKVNADYDRKIIGTGFPKYNFGANFRAGYKRFDLSIQLQGVAGYNQIISGYEGNAFMHGSSPQQWMIDNHWTAENPNPHAAYPRFTVLGENDPQLWTSTFVMLNASYLRINDVQLGYSLPKVVLDRIKITDVRFYIAVKNLYTFDHYREGWDPGIHSNYPSIRYTSLGVNVNF